MTFFRELQRRKVFRVAAAYAVVAWLLLQVADVVFPALLLPDWTLTFVTVLVVLGFPAAIVLAWALDLTPEGIRLEQPEGDSTAAPSRLSGKAWAYILSAVIAAVILASVSTRVLIAPEPAVVASGRPSIAVLPFEDLSPDGDQEYFADGMADELLNALARLNDIDVASRTSSFAFKGSGETATSIGQQLGVNHVLDGSVRKSGDRLRITAQLIRVADGFQLWSPEPYDRELTDIFEIQEEIAREVAGALGVQFGIGGSNEYRGAGTRNIEAYEEYLRSFNVISRDEHIRRLEKAVEYDPNYAAALAELGRGEIARAWDNLPSARSKLFQNGLPYIERAVELDPDNVVALNVYGIALYASQRWSEGHRALLRAIELKSNAETNADAHGSLASLLNRAGRSTAALQEWQAAADADPDDYRAFRSAPNQAYALIALRQYDQARALLPVMGPEHWRYNDVKFFLALNDGTREDVRMSVEAFTSYPDTSVTSLLEPLLEVFDDRDAVIALLHEVDASAVVWPTKWHDIARLAAYFDDPEYSLELAAREARNFSGRNYGLWMPHMSEVRKLPGFKELVTDVGLVEYWREFGWTHVCQPLGDDDFTCD